MVRVVQLLIRWFGIQGGRKNVRRTDISVNVDLASLHGPPGFLGGKLKVRQIDIRVTEDLASLPGPPGFLGFDWVQVHAGHITSDDVAAWPYSVGILVRLTSFLGTLHWPSDSADLGHFGISFLELLILFEQWAGHRLLSEKVVRPHVRAGRPILLPSVPVSEGIENKTWVSVS